MAVRDVIQAAAGALGGDKLYVEDVFSTYLYKGNGSTQTITNGIDLAGEGGLVWLKSRSAAADHLLIGQNPVLEYSLTSNSTDAQSATYAMQSFNSNGFTMNTSLNANVSGTTYASWTFRKAPKFFDVVTYTGTGSAQNIAHNLGSAPGFLIVKPIDSTGGWTCWHRSLSNSQYMRLNTTAAVATDTGYWNNTAPTSTQFSVGSTSITNGSGITYVAYLFAHDAGGFGDDGEQNVIRCGSYTSNSGGAINVELGFEPQWILLKNTAGRNAGWVVLDTMRGFSNDAVNNLQLLANASYEELDVDEPGAPRPTATGFSLAAGNNYAEYNYNTDKIIYIAIRRGPMKTPESGTEVFDITQLTQDTSPVQTDLSVIDFNIQKRSSGELYWFAQSRLTGNFLSLRPNYTYAESSYGGADPRGEFDSMGKIQAYAGDTVIIYSFRRAPGFFDVVCYTGTGSNVSIAHNLQAVPQLAIIKKRNGDTGWVVGCPLLSNTAYGLLNDPIFFYTSGGNPYFQNTAWSDQYLYLSTDQDVNDSGGTYVAYLFASCPGVSKVGSFTNSGSDVNVDCGFTTGARFILIKRSSGVDDWYVYDSARGITTGNDPYLTLNTTAAEVTNNDGIAPLSSGFTLKGSQWNNGTYIYLAIA